MSISIATRLREQDAVDFIARMLAGADLLDIETTNDFGFATRWLLVPVGYAELEFLAAYRAEGEDLEHGADMEESGDEHEPSLGSLGSCVTADRTNQERWAQPTDHYFADAELDDCDDEDGDQDEEHDGREPDQDDWNHVEARSPELVPARQVRRPRVPVTRHADLSEWRKL